jgi:ketosteroid isomerase-like protein
VEGKPVSNVPDLDANKAIARKFFDFLSAGDVAGLLSIYGDDFTCWTAGSLPFSGTHPREEIAAMVNGVTSVFPKGWRFTVRALTAEGERVAVEAECLGAHVSGKTYEQKYAACNTGIRQGCGHCQKERRTHVDSGQEAEENRIIHVFITQPAQSEVRPFFYHHESQHHYGQQDHGNPNSFVKPGTAALHAKGSHDQAEQQVGNQPPHCKLSDGKQIPLQPSVF